MNSTGPKIDRSLIMAYLLHDVGGISDEIIEAITELDLTHLGIKEIPNKITKFTNLRSLDLGFNKIEEISDDIVNLQHLEILTLNSNNISELPNFISKIKSLRKIYLSFNNFIVFPRALLELKNLETLNLGNNKLQELPTEIWKLENLTELYLYNNAVTNIPSTITQLDRLKLLDCQNNPLVTPPLEISNKGVPAIKEFFRQLEEGQDYLYEAKLIIIGEGGAGKTTLAKKIIDPAYRLQQEERSTEGIDVLRWDFQLENKKIFRVNIWDFGGQEIYHATHQFFLTKRSLYILVADTRKEDTDFYYWLNVVELLSDSSPLLILKNEKQDRHREINERQLRGQFDNLKEVLASNLATNRDLYKVIDEIKHYMKNLSHIGSALPKTWVKVRNHLENDSRNYIGLEEYIKICKKNGFAQVKDSLQLSGYLHDLGVFLHFQDDPLLNKTVILKPKWGTDAVYKVLDNRTVIRNLGRFTRDDLKAIWQEDEYDSVHDELLQLMMKFKLCYQIPGSINTYIAPQLLTENQPNYQWDDKDNLYLRYTYEFMPKGILTQFIVVMHAFILEQTYVWKSGVVLEKDNTLAEVLEHYSRREIQIRISGAHKIELMAILLHEIDKIHSSYKRLRSDKLIPCNCADCKHNVSPTFYPYERLQKFIEDKQWQIQCPHSYKMVDVRKLIVNVISENPLKSSDININSGETKRNRLFISYSHHDREWLKKVQQHLKVVEEIGIGINFWDDTQIRSGMKWYDEIKEALSSTRVAVLLVSTDFLASDFINNHEIPSILKAAEEDGATILPLILKPSLYTSYPNLKDYQSVNDPSKPLSKLSEAEQDEILVSMAQRIIELME